MHEPTCVWPVAAALGEGPLWSPAGGALWFVDIKGRTIHRYHLKTEDKKSFPVPEQVGFVALHAHDGRLVAGLQSGLHLFDPVEGTLDKLADVEADDLGNRINDGHTDHGGRLWFGTMDDAIGRRSGALYSWDGMRCMRHEGGFGITNGPCASPDGRTFYLTDTLDRTIYAYDLSPDGVLSNKRPLLIVEEGAGNPDGTIVDAAGDLWVALWGGSCVRRYSPDGELRQQVDLPAPNVTKLALGGPDLRTAFVTTAREDMDEAALAERPLAGGLFAFRVETPGLPAQPARAGYGGAKMSEEEKTPPKDAAAPTPTAGEDARRRFRQGVGVGIGSAAIVAALLYARKGKGTKD